MTEKVEEKINQLSVYEQNAQYIGSQRQRFQAQLLEIDSALNEIKDKKDAYKLIGNIMVKQSSEQIKKELDEKKELINIRIDSIKKQEETIKKKAAELQKEVMDALDNSAEK